MRRFGPPVRVIFGARDRYLNPRVAGGTVGFLDATEGGKPQAAENARKEGAR
jgi:hypothetical protein